MPSWETKAADLNSQKIYTAELELGKDDGGGGVDTTDLRLSDMPILPPSLAVKPHLAQIKGPPEIKWSMRLSTLGECSLGLGRLQVYNRDGCLDDYVANWNWCGRPITVKLGFDELSTTDFRAMITGQTGSEVKTEGRLIDVPLVDPMAKLWNKRLAAGTYSDTIPNLVSTCLTAAGITNINTTDWNTWAAANNFNAWVESQGDNGEETGRIMQRILGPIGCDFGFDPDGAFSIGTLSAPSGTADLRLDDQAEVLKTKPTLQIQLWKLSVKYYTTTGSSPVYGTVSQSDSSILNLNDQADEDERTTCLTSATDAQTVLTRLWNVFSVQRCVLSLTCKVKPWGLARRGQVEIYGSRDGLDGLYRLVGLKANLGKSQTTLELWR